MRARLVIVRGEGTPSALDLDPDHPITLGRSRDNTMVLHDRHAARLHAQVYNLKGRWYLRDCGTRNHTYVNAARVQGETPLLDGQEIAIADLRLRFLLRCGGKLPPPDPALDPAWRTPTVLHLAQAIDDDRAFEHLPILADALEEAGCRDQPILDHLRGPGPHVRGCWPLELILGRAERDRARMAGIYRP
jgi:hypothetical protein